MGAKDIVIIPAIIKKGTCSFIMVIAKPEDTAKLTQKIITETDSLEIRII